MPPDRRDETGEARVGSTGEGILTGWGAPPSFQTLISKRRMCLVGLQPIPYLSADWILGLFSVILLHIGPPRVDSDQGSHWPQALKFTNIWTHISCTYGPYMAHIYFIEHKWFLLENNRSQHFMRLSQADLAAANNIMRILWWWIKRSYGSNSWKSDLQHCSSRLQSKPC